MDEAWEPVKDFPAYLISDHGRVLNEKSGRILALGANQKGIVTVGLFSRGLQHKRAVSTLVARAFLPSPRHETFNTVINKDGDRQNNFASNLDWRPQWFTVKYHAQFSRRDRMPNLSIADMETGEEFISLWDAATKYGLLVTDIFESMEHQTSVWPTHQRFWRTS